MTTSTRDTKFSIPALRAAVDGEVITSEDPDYDEARTIFYGGIDRHPAVIVRVANEDDVSHVVSLARENGTELAIRSGGHSLVGHSVTEGGIVLDLGMMRGLEIDPASRTAWVETGLTAGEYTIAAAEHGLATGFGDTGSVGIGGITLGGGIGFLVRKHGLTIDSLLAADIVTADGRLLRVDADNHPDLFWAIRGGGGNFGVATRFKFRLHPVDTVVGGLLILPATPDTVHSLVSLAKAAPEELSIISNLMVAPPMPYVPKEAHGKLVLFVLMVYAGDTEAGEKAVAPFRELATPLADMVRPMTYPEIYFPEEEDFHPIAVGRTMFVDEIDESTAEVVVERVRTASATMAVVQLRVLGGAAARVPNDATAYAHRDRGLMVGVAAMFENLEDKDIYESWVDELASEIRGDDPTAYVNFIGEEGADRVRHAYPGATWDRLAAVKRKYDPSNLFRLNHNIPPGRE